MIGRGIIRWRGFQSLLFGIVLFATFPTARAQLWFTAGGAVNETTFDGKTIENQLVNGGDVEGLAISGNTLYTADFYNGIVGEYNATTGAPINSSLISNDVGADAVAIANHLIYVSNYYGSVTAYTLTSNPVPVWTISGLHGAGQVAFSGNNLFVTEPFSFTGGVDEYNAITGAPEQMDFISSVGDDFGIAISGSDMFVSSYGGRSLGEYTTSGVTINPSLVTGLEDGVNQLAIAGDTIYVADSDTVDAFNMTSWASTETINGFQTTGIAAAPSVPDRANTAGILLIALVALRLAAPLIARSRGASR